MAAHLAMPILVVEDNKTMLRIVRQLLWKIGFKRVDDASDGLTALVKMSEKSYDLVLSDWNMEPMSGYELLRQVRADPDFAGTRFILMAAGANTEQVIAAKKAGASNYVAKPFTAEALKAKIDSAFADGKPEWGA
jgi:two-component system, chemotaxis family, chemotaxis protein CheY